MPNGAGYDFGVFRPTSARLAAIILECPDIKIKKKVKKDLHFQSSSGIIIFVLIEDV